ncbi:hypothetical protein SAMN05421812_10334 [Asanoa hainanensis]|uniref:Uncharacterized protein n=1 Tax=Asanoa hainanensis TaxID=560556 RepID=A0A239JM78_9ACTN|nr:hypothetical protein SAMN05421812_10334 [Asanoa hainanensis]
MIVTELTDHERATLKRAAFGVVYLVSNADPGFLAMLRESVAASGAFTGARGLARDVLTSGSLPRFPRRDPSQVEAEVLPALTESLAILRAKVPDEVDNYRDAVLSAAQRAAEAAHGVRPSEAAVLAKVRAALA